MSQFNKYIELIQEKKYQYNEGIIDSIQKFFSNEIVINFDVKKTEELFAYEDTNGPPMKKLSATNTDKKITLKKNTNIYFKNVFIQQKDLEEIKTNKLSDQEIGKKYGTSYPYKIYWYKYDKDTIALAFISYSIGGMGYPVDRYDIETIVNGKTIKKGTLSPTKPRKEDRPYILFFEKENGWKEIHEIKDKSKKFTDITISLDEDFIKTLQTN